MSMTEHVNQSSLTQSTVPTFKSSSSDSYGDIVLILGLCVVAVFLFKQFFSKRLKKVFGWVNTVERKIKLEEKIVLSGQTSLYLISVDGGKYILIDSKNNASIQAVDVTCKTVEKSAVDQPVITDRAIS